MRAGTKRHAQTASPLSSSEQLSAESAGLYYVTDRQPGIRRVRAGSAFSYRDPEGRLLRDRDTLARIKALAIPPAWTDVWICSNPRGHLQAVGRDDRRRKQYRYHPRWREVRDETKYNRMISFGKALPVLRRRVHHDIRQPELPREKVLAAVVRLLDLSALRIGNEEYANHNKSYGLTTLHQRHARVKGSTISFNFRGKGGKQQQVDVEHPIISKIVRKCQELPGQALFQYLDDDGKIHDISSGDVNDYLAAITGKDFTAKDFRTWTGTVLAALALRELEPPGSKRKLQRNIVRAIERVAEHLGNTPAVCKKCYVHPVILESYIDGQLVSALRKTAEREIRNSVNRFRPAEAAVIALLQQRLKTSEEDRLHRGLKASLRQKARKAAQRTLVAAEVTEL